MEVGIRVAYTRIQVCKPLKVDCVRRIPQNSDPLRVI